MTQKISLPSPAKLNLMLHITGRREDGYHNLQTLFQILDYGDKLDFELTHDGKISVSPHIEGLAEADNLIYKAALLLQQSTRCKLGAKIHLHKRLPMGGGLGGGSSNAASTLVGLNHLWKTQLPLSQLADIGLQLGADVPVFVHGKSAWAEGVGEHLTPVTLDESWFLVAIPDCSVSTQEIFSHKLLTRDSKPIRFSPALNDGGRNDCEQVVCMLYPKVKSAMAWLNQFGEAKITGTGCCVYAKFSTEQDATKAIENMPIDIKGFVAKGQNVSELHKTLENV